ncbi:MAG: FHA domain-containing protein [Prevotella sp.]
MRLLKVGRDNSCDIVLHSDKVSSLHAEITLLNSGDIMIEDKGSRNGTFVMNHPIQPGKSVSIRRGDMVRFADVELQWSQVPMPEDNSAYKAIFGIGTHFNNDIQVSGSTVSRYHATVKVGKDNKVYIVDHSKNGTTVDGVKIPSHTPCRIKKSSAVACGGVSVSLAKIPWPAQIGLNILKIAAVLLVLVGVGFGTWKWIDNTKKVPLKALENATACVLGQYIIDVKFDDDPFIGQINGWPEKWEFGLMDGKLALGTLTGNKIAPISYTGTAFFISPDGELGTNRHIAAPWEYLSNDEKNTIKQELTKFFNTSVTDFLLRLLNANVQLGNMSFEDAKAYLSRIQKSGIKITGHIEYLGLIMPGTNFTTIADLASCQVIADSGSEDKDVALIRLNSKKTPEDIVRNGYYDITKARVDESTLIPQEEELTSIGYPAQYGTGENVVSKGKEYLPTVHRMYISKTPDDNMFQLQSNVVGGQSGSPIIDKNHRLVGVVWGSHRGTDVAYGCNIKHLKELYDKNKARK